MKSDADIVAEELEKVLNSPKMKKLLKAMDNVNPSELCLLCGKHVGKKHVICPKCYLREGVNMM